MTAPPPPQCNEELTEDERAELRSLLAAVLLPQFSVREREVAGYVAGCVFRAKLAEIARLTATANKLAELLAERATGEGTR